MLTDEQIKKILQDHGASNTFGSDEDEIGCYDIFTYADLTSFAKACYQQGRNDLIKNVSKSPILDFSIKDEK